MTGRVVEFFEIILPRCANTYGVAPCTASIPTTGDAKCFNCLSTCQDTDNFVDTTETLRFAKPASFLPRDIDIVGPWIKDIDFTPATISLAESLGTRAVLKVTLADNQHTDAGAGLDKYQSERGYDPYDRGSFWPRFCARYPSLDGVECAWIIGEVGQSLEEMERRTFFIEGGPTGDGAVTITAKDALKFLDGAKAQIPVLSEGSLVADITISATSLTLTPSGVGADYAETGYLNLAGKEIVSYQHDPGAGNDTSCVLLLHMDGTNASTTFPDSSSSARTMTANGNAQISTAESKFGGASGLFDGTTDWVSAPDSAAWTFAGDFTIEAWIRSSSLSSNRIIVSHSTDGNNGWRLGVGATGDIFFNHIVAGVITISVNSATGLISTGTWYHLALVRSGNEWVIYLNGVSVATITQATAFTNFTSTLKIGINIDASTWSWAGYIDELRISNVARWPAAFTPPGAAYQTSVDLFTIVRAQLGTTASAHSGGDRAQIVKRYAAVAAADIIADAIENYTDLSPDYIPLAEWQLEDSTNLGTLYSFTLGEPVAVSAFVSRVLEQSGSMMWDDALAKLLRFRVIKAVPASADVISEANVINNTFDLIPQPDQRVSRAYVYYGINDPTRRRDDLDNYRQSARLPDEDTALASERLYGSQSLRKIIADGIAIGGGSVAQRVGNLVVGRKQRPPRRFKWSMLRGSNLPLLGGGYFIDWRSLQDASGLREPVPVQVVSNRVSSTIHQFLAEEMRFTDLDTGSSTDRVLLINFDGFNLNLRAIHDLTYPSTFVGVTVTFLISATIGSHSAAIPAVDVGSWDVGFVPSVVLTGRLQGKGGAGGSGNGSAGGTALYTRAPINLTDASGAIWGGGGGGAEIVALAGGGGGGGAGQDGGPGGHGNSGDGAAGTATAGGSGTSGGGNGGGPGLAGSASHTNSGGAAGRAIDGVSYVTTVGSAGDRRGGQVN